MCIGCSNEDMTEFKDQPEHYPDPHHPCLVAQFPNHQAVFGKYEATAKMPSKKHPVKTKAFQILSLKSQVLMSFSSLLQKNIFKSQQIFLRWHLFMQDT